MDNSLIPIIKELERIYDAINLKFDFHYPRPIITIQTRGRKKNTTGWFGANRWTKEQNPTADDKTGVGEINICAECLHLNPIETLIHEMAHYANHCEGITDCSANQYHNGDFKIKAENYGLTCEKDTRRGWAATSISEKLQIILNDLKVDTKLFKMYRKAHFAVTAPTKMKKFRCNCTTVRCAVDLSATCKKCGKEFEEQ